MVITKKRPVFSAVKGIVFNFERKDKRITDNTVWVEGGSFLMGSESDTDYGANPPHLVSVNDFYIGKYLVTQGQYLELMGINPSYFQGTERALSLEENQDKRPVEQVSWFDAVEFCNKLSILRGFKPVYKICARVPEKGPISRAIIKADMKKNGYRLPTEAEWEYAARGGKPGEKPVLPDGDDPPLNDSAWLMDNSRGKTHEVGRRAPIGLGIFDMGGNVWEWCWDWFGGYSSEAQASAQGEAGGYTRVTRGGGWSHSTQDTLLTFRGDVLPVSRLNVLGFRLARSSV